MKKQRFIAGALALAVSITASAFAQSYVFLIGDIQGIDSLAQLTSAIGKAMNVKIEVKKVPMQRMVNMIIDKQADFGAPMLKLKDPDVIKALPYDYSTGTVQQMCFVLYSNKSKPVNIDNLKSGNGKGYKIESDIANMQMFNFTTQPSTNAEASLRKVNDGLIDGYIMGATTDFILRANKDKLMNIRRQLWDIYDIGYAIQKGARGSTLDKMLSAGIKKMKDTGKLQKILAEVTQTGIYDDWQP